MSKEDTALSILDGDVAVAVGLGGRLLLCGVVGAWKTVVGGDLVLAGDVAMELVARDDLVLSGLAGFEVGRLAVLADDGDLAEVVESLLVFTVFFGKVD